MQSHKNMILSDYLLTLTLGRVIHLFPKSAWQNFICDPLASRLVLVAVFQDGIRPSSFEENKIIRFRDFSEVLVPNTLFPTATLLFSI